MPIDSTHPKFNEHVDEWITCRDSVAGERAVKAAGERYLPMLAGMDPDEYQKYKTRASFHNASQRTVKGLSGSIFRKKMKVEYPGQKPEDRLAAIGDDGQSIESLAQEAAEELLIAGRLGMLVDASEDNNAMPYISFYCTENITNWRTVWYEGKKILQAVVLKECVFEQGDDPYDLEEIEQYRELLLIIGETSTPFYRVNIWRLVENEDKKGSSWKIYKTIEPTKTGGKKLEYIPFQIVSPIGVGVDIEPSPIKDLVSVNIGHYRNSADYEHGCHYTALPTPYALGFDEQKSKLKIGSGVAWVSKNEQAKVGMLEFTGAGLGSLRDAMQDKESLMAVHGSRLLEKSKNVQEAAKTVEMRHTGEDNVLASIATACGQALTTALQWLADWEGISGKADVELSTDFGTYSLDAPTLTALMTSMQAGQLSFTQYFFNLKRGGMYAEDWTEEEELAAIQKGPPMPEPTTTETVTTVQNG